MGRRDLLTSLQGALALLVAVASAPSLLLWWRSSRQRERQAEWTDVGPAGRIEQGSWQGRTLRRSARDRWREVTSEEAVYVRRGGETIEVLSSVCTHTGCLVRTQGDGFACPCHRSLFDAEGRSVEGPAPRPLDRLEGKVERGRLFVRYQRFRPGIARKEPLEA
jgi:menaquinol-cytochrome c reductase iron-sulfur subunit